jgi:hypothetical protein
VRAGGRLQGRLWSINQPESSYLEQPMSSESSLALIDVHGQHVCNATMVDGEVTFADPAIRWTWVLDARHDPYVSLERDDVLHRAEHARKLYVLFGQA